MKGKLVITVTIEDDGAIVPMAEFGGTCTTAQFGVAVGIVPKLVASFAQQWITRYREADEPETAKEFADAVGRGLRGTVPLESVDIRIGGR